MSVPWYLGALEDLPFKNYSLHPQTAGLPRLHSWLLRRVAATQLAWADIRDIPIVEADRRQTHGLPRPIQNVDPLRVHVRSPTPCNAYSMHRE